MSEHCEKCQGVKSAYVEVAALLEYITTALDGEEVSDFAESFPVVRKAVDVATRAKVAEAALEKANR